MPPKLDKHLNRNVKKAKPNDDAETFATSIAITAINHLLEAINLMDRPKSIAAHQQGNSECRKKIYDAIEVLRQLTPNDGNQMHINQLTDDCLVAIFERRFSMQTQICKLRAVCPRWKKAIESLVCGPKRSLKLFCSKGAPQKYSQKLINLNLYSEDKFKLRKIGQHDHDLVLSRYWTVNFELFNFFGSLFPNVEHLVLGTDGVSNSDQIQLPHIIKQWPSLNHLSLFVNVNRFDKSFVLKMTNFSLYKAINSLSALKSLDLLGDAFQDSQSIANQLSQVLPQLEHLSLENCILKDFGSLLNKFESNLVSLGLDNFKNTVVDNLNNCLSNQTASSIKKVRLSFVASDSMTVKSICSMFPHLTRLELSFTCKSEKDERISLNVPLVNILNGLAHLRELSFTNLEIDLNSLESSATLSASQVTSLRLTNLFVSPLIGTSGQLLATVLASIFPVLERLDYQFGVRNCELWNRMKTFIWGKCNLNRKYFHEMIPSLRECSIYYWRCSNDHLGRHDPIVYDSKDICDCCERFDAED